MDTIYHYRGPDNILALERVKSLLDEGADPNLPSHTWSAWRLKYASPLSNAIKVNSIPIFNLLLERGADIHGMEVYRHISCTIPMHIPIFAAACSISYHGTTTMQRCLDLGADINIKYAVQREVPDIVRSNNCWWKRNPSYTHWTSPILTYLISIFNWRSKPLHPHGRYSSTWSQESRSPPGVDLQALFVPSTD